LKSFKDGSFEKEMLQIPGNCQSTAIDEWYLMGITEVYLIILVLCISVKSPLGLVLYCYLNMPTMNKNYLILFNVKWAICHCYIIAGTSCIR
jgi:hypothetical protein